MSLAAILRAAPRHGWPALVVLFGLALYAGNTLRHQARYWDDAFITFRFANHLAEGQGLVWNLGGERVEGYTSFAHVVLLAGASRAGYRPESIALAFSVAAVVATVAIMLWMIRRHAGGVTVASSLPVALFVAGEPTAIHSTSGLETPLFMFCLTAGMAVALRLLEQPRWTAAALLAVVSWITLLCRPEGALFSAAVYALLLAAARVQGRDLRLARLTVISGVLLVALTGLYAAWKYSYFGYLLPNPYYVKSNRISLAGFSNVRDFIEYAVWRLGPVAALAVVMIAAAVRRSAIPARAGAILAMLLVPAMLGLGFYLTIIHEVGGAHRFSYPLLVYVTLAVAFSASFASNAPAASTHSAAGFRPELVLGPASIAWLLALQPAYDFRPLPRGGFNDYHFRIAEALRDTGLGPSATVLTDAAGVIPYVSGFNQLDRVGLTDNHLSGRVPLAAVERETYIWSREPDVYIGYEPPARAGAESPAADPLMRTPYVFDILLHRRLQTIEDRIFVQDEALLHTRMRELRDNWYWIGEIDWPGLRLWKLKSFLYVRKSADQRLRTHLAVLVDRTPEQIVFDNVTETRRVVRASP